MNFAARLWQIARCIFLHKKTRPRKKDRQRKQEKNCKNGLPEQDCAGKKRHQKQRDKWKNNMQSHFFIK
jgi:hypothetical protein